MGFAVRLARTFVLLGVAFTIPAVALAQETTGTITGQVVDAQGLGVPGATVTITSAQGDRTYVTDNEGRFFAPFLTPGPHSIRVELQGFTPATVAQVEVQLGQRVTVPPITLRIGGLAEQVQVIGEAPVVDTTSSAIGTTLDSEFLERLPTQRQVSDVVYLAPGVSTSGFVGRANPSISGASGLENQYIIDGVNVSNSGFGGVGSYSIVFGSLGTGVPFDFVKEVQVRTGGYEAEFGQATGGIVQAVTKSGGNTFSGSAFLYAQPKDFQGNFRQTDLPNATREDESVNTTETSFSDAGFTFSGPVLRNRLFFFGALDGQWNTTTLIAPGTFPLRTLGAIDQDRQTVAYSAKATLQMNAANRIDFSVFGDPANGDMGPQRRESLLRTEATGFSEIDYGGHNQTLRYDGVPTNNFLLTASIAHASNNIEEQPGFDQWQVTDFRTTPNLVAGGIGFYELGNKGSNVQYDAKATYLWRGHEFRGGIHFEDIDYDNIINRTGPTFVLPDGTRTVTGAEINLLPDPTFGAIYRVVRANTSNVRETNQHYTSVFIQDTWTIGDRLTIRPGIRYEQQRLVGNLAEFTWDGNWAPRIGVTWDPTGTGRGRVFANWGRYFAQIPNDLAARALSADAGVTRADYFDPNLTLPVPEGVLAAGATTHFVTAGLEPAVIDPESKSTYSDELVVGAEHEIVQGLTVGANYQRRRFGRILEDVGTAPMVAYFLDFPGLDSVEYFITNPSPATPTLPGIPASFEEAIHEYDAVTLTAVKRIGQTWGLQSSYRYARLEGTFEGFFRNDNEQSDPAITSLFDFPTNDPSYTQIGVPQFGFRGDIRFLGELGAGPLPLDRRHSFKVYGNYVTRIGLNLGIGFNAFSGTPLTPMAANPLYDSTGEIPEAPRGAGFQTIDGFRDRTPWLTSVDLHGDYALPFGANRRLLFLADVFNLFNRRAPLDYDNYTEAAFGVENPDFGRVIQFQEPIRARVGVRFDF